MIKRSDKKTFYGIPGADGKVTFTVDASATKADADGKKYVDIYSGYSSMTGDPFKLESVLISGDEGGDDPVTPSIVYGDVDGTPNITLADAIVVLEIATGTAASDEIKVAADVDGITNVTLADAILVLERATGSTSPFPVEQ